MDKVANKRFRLLKIGTATQTIPSINSWLSVPTCSFLIFPKAFSIVFLEVSVFTVFCSKFKLPIKLESCSLGSRLRKSFPPEVQCRGTFVPIGSCMRKGQWVSARSNISLDFNLELKCCRSLQRHQRVALI